MVYQLFEVYPFSFFFLYIYPSYMYAHREGIYWYPDFPILLLSIHVYDELDILSIIKFKNKKCLGMVHQKDLGMEFFVLNLLRVLVCAWVWVTCHLLLSWYVTACSHFQAAIRFMIEAPVPRYFAMNEATGNITLSKELNISLETTFQVSDIMI